MQHDEHCGCGCAPSHPTNASSAPFAVTQTEKDFLHELGHRHCLPVARFAVEDSREADFFATALSPVFIRCVGDDMAAVKEAGAFLQALEDKKLISLDYDIPVNGYAYEEYKQSALYAYFCNTVAEGAAQPGFLGDTPVLELGSMALTQAGERIAAAHCEHGTHPP